MKKAAFGALLTAAAFGAALYFGGNVMGAWEPYRGPTAEPEAKAAARKPSRARRAKPSRPRKPTTPKDVGWVRRANALCRDARRQSASTRQPRTLEEMQAFVARGRKDNRRWNARFLGLGAPRGDAARFRKLRSLFREDESLLSEVAAAIRERDATSMMFLGRELVDLGRRESRLMMSMGARDCTLPGGAVT